MEKEEPALGQLPAEEDNSNKKLRSAGHFSLRFSWFTDIIIRKFNMRLFRLFLINIFSLLIAANLSAQINGSLEVNGEYDSNAYNDSYGGSSIVGTVYLNLSTDIDLKMAGLFWGADYSGNYSAYLSYLGINQNGHFLKSILWRNIGENSYLGFGATYGFQLNAADRSIYDTNNLKGICEAKLSIADPVLLKIDGAMGNYQYANLEKYNFDQSTANASINFYLPTRTSLIVQGGYKNYAFTPQPGDSQVPSKITNFSPGIRLAQNIGKNSGLALGYSYLKNNVQTPYSTYRPDTLLNEVNDYFEYSGNRAEAKLSVIAAEGIKFSVWGNITKREYTNLNAFSLPASDTASVLTRQDLGSIRIDNETIIGADYSAPISEGANPINLNAGIYYDINSSNDELYNYKKLLVYAGLAYNF